MKDVNLHPSVVEFKNFINNYPKLLVAIRESGSSWQEYYEKWALLGEDDSMWDEYKEISTESESEQDDFLNGLLAFKDNLNFSKIEKQVTQLGNTIHIVHGLLSDFQETKQSKSDPKNHVGHPTWFRD